MQKTILALHLGPGGVNGFVMDGQLLLCVLRASHFQDYLVELSSLDSLSGIAEHQSRILAEKLGSQRSCSSHSPSLRMVLESIFLDFHKVA